MNYTDKIEAYTTKKMSAFEQLIFEQELAENGSLKEAFEAHQLTDTLLNFTANNLSEAAILGDISIPPKTIILAKTSNRIYYSATLLILCLIGLFFYSYIPSSKTIAPTSTIETKQVITTPNTPTSSNQTEKETILFQDPILKVKPTQKNAPISKPAKVKTKTINQAKPIAAVNKKVQSVTVPIKKAVPILVANLSSKKQIQKGETVSFTAGQSITFKPGFVVEMGGSLHAKIEDKTIDR